MARKLRKLLTVNVLRRWILIYRCPAMIYLMYLMLNSRRWSNFFRHQFLMGRWQVAFPTITIFFVDSQLPLLCKCGKFSPPPPPPHRFPGSHKNQPTQVPAWWAHHQKRFFSAANMTSLFRDVFGGQFSSKTFSHMVKTTLHTVPKYLSVINWQLTWVWTTIKKTEK